MDDFTEGLRGDLVEQFRGHPNIGAVMEAVEEQLREVADFFNDLRELRNLQKAIGAQLDGAGDIIVLTRAEAGQLASLTNPGEAVTDEVYRKYLVYKVLKNTNTCTYPDIIKAFQMFWEKPLYYSEDPAEPATMIFRTDVLSPEDTPELLLNAPIIKAAGVGVKVISTVETPEIATRIFFATALGRGYTVTKLPELEPDFRFAHSENITTVAHNVSRTVLPELKEV